jgi:hypothetical protein
MRCAEPEGCGSGRCRASSTGLGDGDKRSGRSLAETEATGAVATVGDAGVDPKSAAKPPRQSMLNRRTFSFSVFTGTDGASEGSGATATKVDVWRLGLLAADPRKVLGRRKEPCSEPPASGRADIRRISKRHQALKPKGDRPVLRMSAEYEQRGVSRKLKVEPQSCE